MTHNLRRAVLSAAGVAVLCLTACAGDPADPVGTWGNDATGEPQLVLESNGDLGGTDGCNRLSGSWERGEESRIEFGTVAATQMACEDVDTWLSGLSAAELDGDTLLIFDEAGEQIGSLTRSD